MKTYVVRLRRNIAIVKDVIVDAENAEDAMENAMGRAEEHNWLEVGETEPEVESCEEVEDGKA